MSVLDIGLTSEATYDKIALKGTGTLSISGFGDTDTDTITHNLGYKPNVRVWFDPDNDGTIWVPHKRSILTNALLYFKVKDNTLEITAENGSVGTETVPYYYRIYHDGETLDDNALDSDRDTEKILLTGEGSESVNASTTDTITISHSEAQAEFVKMIFSVNEFEWHEEGLPAWDDTYSNYITAICHMDSSNITLLLENGYSSTQTIYYKYVVLRRN